MWQLNLPWLFPIFSLEEDPISQSSPLLDTMNQLKHLKRVNRGSIRSLVTGSLNLSHQDFGNSFPIWNWHFLHQVKQTNPPFLYRKVWHPSGNFFPHFTLMNLVLSCSALFPAPQHDCKLDQYLDPSVPHPSHLEVKYHLAAIFAAHYSWSPDGLENLGMIMQTNKSTYATLSTKDSNWLKPRRFDPILYDVCRV